MSYQACPHVDFSLKLPHPIVTAPPASAGSRALRGLFLGALVVFVGMLLIHMLERAGIQEALGSPTKDEGGRMKAEEKPSFSAFRLPPSAFRAAGASVVNGRTYNGEELTCDFPASQHMTNIGSRVDGAGMCVMTAIEMNAMWSGLTQMHGLRDFCAQQPGGGYPGKVDAQIKQFCAAKGIPVPDYLQYEGPNPEAILDALDKSGRMASITYGYSPRYGGTIAHMTNCPHFSAAQGVCMDNNFIGGVDREHLFEWMSRDELLKRMKHPSGSAWVFAWLAPGPPPVPRNAPAPAPAPLGDCEIHGPYYSRLVALDKADRLRERGYKCHVFQQTFGRWYVRACK